MIVAQRSPERWRDDLLALEGLQLMCNCPGGKINYGADSGTRGLSAAAYKSPSVPAGCPRGANNVPGFSGDCHVELIIDLFNVHHKRALSTEAAPPATDTEALRAAEEQKAKAKGVRERAKVAAYRVPSRIHGRGPPLMVGFGESRRLL